MEQQVGVSLSLKSVFKKEKKKRPARALSLCWRPVAFGRVQLAFWSPSPINQHAFMDASHLQDKSKPLRATWATGTCPTQARTHQAQHFPSTSSQGHLCGPLSRHPPSPACPAQEQPPQASQRLTAPGPQETSLLDAGIALGTTAAVTECGPAPAPWTHN